MIATLLLIAAPAQQGAQLGATATARILPGARISLAEQTVQNASVQPQRTVVVRQLDSRSGPIYLLEFQ